MTIHASVVTPPQAPAEPIVPSDRHSRPASTRWPWYRGEPWLAVLLAAFLPTWVGFFVPAAIIYPLLAVSGLLVVLAFAMLLRQGVFRAHPPR